MNVGYEEKTYESYFNNELDTESSIYFPLGQVQEGVLGMDSVAFSKNKKLWKVLGHPFMGLPNFSGVLLKDMAKEMELLLKKTVNNIPPMKVNLLFQYKRPEYMTQSHSKEWGYWNNSYFRYELYEKQHNLLEHLEKIFGGDALVLYAAPAIKDIEDLVDLKQKRQIINNTNFKKASDLSGHRTNTYRKAGNFSIACSDPKEIEDFDLLHFLERKDVDVEKPNDQIVSSFSESVTTIFLETSSDTYKNAYRSLIQEYDKLEDRFPIFLSMIRMKIIRELTGIQWLISY